MITSVQNMDYTILFKEATETIKLLDQQGVITLTQDEKKYLDEAGYFTSLEQYFTHLGDLVAYADSDKLPQDKRNSPIKFLMLPLDEPPLEVDANSRIISVPEGFKKYGVSVQGDSMAETLFLRIDRFFDYMDFLETEAYVQWKLPNGDEGASKIPYIDYESESNKGKLILVWPLTKAVTEQSGTLTFSLRFFQKDAEQKISYSWNSLPCSINIKQALKPEWDYPISEIENSESIFNTIIKNSSNISGADADKVDPPSFKGDAGYKFIGLEDAEKAYLHRTSTTLTKNNGQTITEPENSLELRAASFIQDSGIMSYSWSYLPLGQVGASTLTGGVEFDEISESEYTRGPVAFKEYYIKNDKALPYGYERVNFEKAKEDGLTMYERVAVHRIEKGDDQITGTYTLTASHRYGFPTNSDSISIVIPGPEDISFKTDLKEGKKTGDFISNDNKASLKVDINRETVPATAWQGVTYNWKYSGTSESAADITETLEEHVTYDATTDTLDMTNAKPGWYKVDVTTMVNRDVKTIGSKVQRLTKRPEAPKLKYNYYDEKGEPAIKAIECRDANGKPLKNVEVKCEIDEFKSPSLLYSDFVKYQWLDDGVVIDENFEHVKAYSDYDKATLKVDCSQLPENVTLRCRVINILNNEESEAVESGSTELLFDSTTPVTKVQG